jgi:hypothetical protein
MKTSILSALAYLIDRQSLTAEEVKEIIIKTEQELES